MVLGNSTDTSRRGQAEAISTCDAAIENPPLSFLPRPFAKDIQVTNL